MSTPAQIAANQSNAQQSTGPKTEAGKAASSQNNFRSGLTGSFRVLPWEEQEDFDVLIRKLHAEHQPAIGFESELVEKIAQHFWLSLRAIRLQDACMDREVPMCNSEKEFALYLRYQTTHDRAFAKCADELRKLRNESRKKQIGFESQERRKQQDAQREANEIRKQAQEKRRQDVHKWAILLAEGKAEHQQLLNINLESPENRKPNRVERILAAERAA